MIRIKNIRIFGWMAAIEGARNPLNSWDKSDSIGSEYLTFTIGPKDHELLMRLAKGGSDHGKWRRMVHVSMDVTAPLYWWKEFDTYKVGTVANSCSTMYTIHKKEFEKDDFSCEHIIQPDDMSSLLFISPNAYFEDLIGLLNDCRNLYLETHDKKYWWQMIQLLPSSYNQKRTIDLNYETLANIYRQRRNHKLDEWHQFCDMIEEDLPYSEFITLKEE